MLRRTRVFIGHASADDGLADLVIARLREGGLEPFADHEPKDGIEIGRDWERELRRSIRAAGLFIPLVSDAWLDSAWCQAEHRVARLLDKPTVPLILDGRLTRAAPFSEQALRVDVNLDALDAMQLRRLRRLCLIEKGRVILVCLVFLAAATAFALVTRREDALPWGTGFEDMARIPGGVVVRGEPAAAGAGAEAPESPERRIRLNPFMIDRHEVSWGEFKDSLAQGVDGEGPPSWAMRYIPSERHPVVAITWGAAAAYCASMGKRLPSEAEWERAARGVSGSAFPWGNETIAVSPDRPAHPAAVDTATFDQTPEKIFHLAGNVREWVQDYYDPNFYAVSADENPVNMNETPYRVVRGGSWLDAELPRASQRGANEPTRPDPEIGFRCAADMR